MSGLDIALIVLAVAGTAAALRVVTTRNVVHGALFLVVALSAVSGVFLVLGAEFVAWVQVLIYVGAIVVLLLFALMLTKAPIGREALDNQQRGLAAVVGLVVFGGIAWLLWNAFGGAVFTPEPASTTEIGALIFDKFVLPFEVVSMLLLAALIGAVVIARKDES
ncbi:MAG: NADH-quinone oxidoreductase subunit J [Actinomycetota bacterium]